MLHAAITNLLVFHKFLDQNDQYRAHTQVQAVSTAAVAPVAPELDSIDADDERADNDTSVVAGPATANEWGLSFPTMTESELMTGLVVKDRLLKLLDHPGLTNHLLRAKNLLPLLVSACNLAHPAVLTLAAGMGWRPRVAPSQSRNSSHATTDPRRPGRVC